MYPLWQVPRSRYRRLRYDPLRRRRMLMRRMRGRNSMRGGDPAKVFLYEVAKGDQGRPLAKTAEYFIGPYYPDILHQLKIFDLFCKFPINVPANLIRLFKLPL